MTESSVRLPGGVPPFVSALKQAAVGLSKEAAKGVNPSAILQSLEDAELEIAVPGTIGRFAQFPITYAVEPNTIMTIKAVVEHGRIVPEKSKIVFRPKLDAIAWVKVEGFSLEARGDEAIIELDLSLFPDLNITKWLLDMKTIPLGVSDLLKVVEAKRDLLKVADLKLDAHTSFAPHDFTLDLKRATFKAGALPLGEHTSIVLAPGNEVVAHGNKDDLRISGRLRISEYALDDGKSSICGGDVDADVNIRVALAERLRGPSELAVDLQNVSGSLDMAILDDGAKNRLTLGAAHMVGARIALGAAGMRTRALAVQLPDVTTHVADATLTVTQGNAPVMLRLGAGQFSGSFSLAENKINVTAKSAQLAASAEHVSLGSGDLSFGYASVAIAGRGELDFDGETATLQGLLGFRGVVSDGSIGREGGPFLVNLKAGSEVALKIDRAVFGPSERSFAGSGDFSAAVDSGEVLLPSGARLVLGAGTMAKVNAQYISASAQGISAQGRIELETAADAVIDPDVLSNDAINVHKVSGAKGRLKVTLDDVSIAPSGRFHIGSAEASVHATVSEVTGKLRTESKLVPVLTQKAPANRVNQGLAVQPPSLESLFATVDTADVSFSLPVPAGSFGFWPANVRIKPGTVAKFEMHVQGGVIDRQRVRLSFTPPIDGPLWIEGNGIAVDENGNFIADLKGFPNINLSKLVFGAVRMPATLAELGAMASKLKDALSSSLGRVIFPGRPDRDPLGTMKKLNARFEARNVAMNGQRLSLGDRASIVPGRSGRYTMSVADGVARLTGRGDITDGDIADDRVLITRMRGSARLDMTLDSEHVEATLDEVAAQCERCDAMSAAGDALTLKDTSVGGGRITLRSTGGGRAEVDADFHDVDARIETSRLRAKEFLVDIPDAAFKGHLQLSPKRIAGRGTVQDMTITLPAIDMPLAVDGGVLKTSGDFAFDTAAGEVEVTRASASLTFATNLGGGLRNLTLADGVHIDRIGANEENVVVTIDAFSLAPDGAFSFRDVAFAADATARGIDGHTDDKTKTLRAAGAGH